MCTQLVIRIIEYYVSYCINVMLCGDILVCIVNTSTMSPPIGLLYYVNVVVIVDVIANELKS